MKPSRKALRRASQAARQLIAENPAIFEPKLVYVGRYKDTLLLGYDAFCPSNADGCSQQFSFYVLVRKGQAFDLQRSPGCWNGQPRGGHWLARQQFPKLVDLLQAKSES